MAILTYKGHLMPIHMSAPMDDILQSFIAGKSVDQIFLDADSEKLLSEYSPEYRTKLLAHFADLNNSRVVCDTEKGVNGGFYRGSVEIWNAEEFSPWQFKNSVTVLLGNLWVEPESIQSTLILEEGALLFVTGDILVGNLEIMNGEVHCLGNVQVSSNLKLAESAYLAARQVIYKKADLQGKLIES